jgi:hypothetical protein
MQDRFLYFVALLSVTCALFFGPNRAGAQSAPPVPQASPGATAGRIFIYLESNQHQSIESAMVNALPAGFMRIGNRNTFQQKIWSTQLLRQIMSHNYDVTWYRSLEEIGKISATHGADGLILGWEKGNMQNPELRMLLFDNNGGRLLLDTNIPLQSDQWTKSFADTPRVQELLRKTMTSLKPRIQAPIAQPQKSQPNNRPADRQMNAPNQGQEKKTAQAPALLQKKPGKEIPKPTGIRDDADKTTPLIYQMLSIRTGLSLAGRTFSYFQADPKTVSDYNLAYPFAMRGDIHLDYFPLTRGQTQNAFDLALLLRFSRTPYQMTSKTKSGEQLQSNWQDLGLGLRLFWCPSNLHFSYQSAYRNILFDFSVSNSAEASTLLASVPSANYQIWQNGFGASWHIGSFTLALEANYLLLFASGKVGETDFPDSTEAGWDINSFIDYKFTENIFARLGGNYVNIDYTLNPPDGHDKDAQTAKDQMLSTEISLAYTF